MDLSSLPLAMLSRPLHLFGADGPENTVRELVIAAAITAATIVAIWVVKALVIRRVRGDEGEGASPRTIVFQVLGRTRQFAGFVVAIYAGSLVLQLPEALARVIPLAAVSAVLLQLGIWASRAISLSAKVLYKKKREEGDGASAGAITLLAVAARGLVWVLVGLLLLANFGVNITALVAGLGVGGLAVALALQKVLSDIFASISIMLDKPFTVGEFIMVGDFLGDVEQIGIKTTRIKSLSGEHLVFSNNDLLDSRIRNYSRMQERRGVFEVGIAYETPLEKVKGVVDLIYTEMQATKNVRPDRVHLKAFGDFAFIYEAVYFVEPADYSAYMDAQQSILFRVLERLRAEDITIAYPTHTVYLNRDEAQAAPAPAS